MGVTNGNVHNCLTNWLNVSLMDRGANMVQNFYGLMKGRVGSPRIAILEISYPNLLLLFKKELIEY